MKKDSSFNAMSPFFVFENNKLTSTLPTFR